MDMPHESLQAFASPLSLAVACFLASGIWLMLWTRNRNGYMLPTALSWLALCAYFGLLAVSAGDAPMTTRGEIAMPLRQWGYVAALLIIAGKGLLLRAWWRTARRKKADST